MQKFSACRNRDSLIHFFFSTSSPCSSAICAVGPPKLIKPNLSQKRDASAKVGAVCRVRDGAGCWKFIGAAKTNRGHRSTQNRDAEFHHQAVLLLPNP